MSDIAIRVDHVSKRYRLGEGQSFDNVRDAVAHAAKAPLRWLKSKPRDSSPAGSAAATAVAEQDEILWALRDVSFEVKRGEVLGIIGRNGAGKSTLLKILSRITEPSDGTIDVFGRVASLLEVGTGFHQDLTGRENIYLNGSILGMTKREIDRKFDEIVAFAGVERFIDTPVKRYSSGMGVRLGFAVAAHLEPEILIVDEVLAVGDAEFQRKCLGKMDDVAKSGRTVLFVSHNMATVQSLCTTGLLLNAGQIEAVGSGDEVVEQYQRGFESGTAVETSLHAHPGRPSDAMPYMQRVRLEDECGRSTTSIQVGRTLRVCVEYDFGGRRTRPVLGVVVKTANRAAVFGVDNRFIGGHSFDPVTDDGSITCVIPDVPLAPGRYYLDLYLGDEQRSLDRVIDAAMFDVISADVYGTGRLPPPVCGPVIWRATWELGGAARTAACSRHD